MVIEHNLDFPKTWWGWILTGIGFIMAFTPLFWIVQIIVYATKENKKKFFDEKFYKVTFYFGIFLTIMLLFALIP